MGALGAIQLLLRRRLSCASLRAESPLSLAKKHPTLRLCTPPGAGYGYSAWNAEGGGFPLGCGRTLWMNAAGQRLSSQTGVNSCITCILCAQMYVCEFRGEKACTRVNIQVYECECMCVTAQVSVSGYVHMCA